MMLDPSFFKQVHYHILANACKYSKVDGIIKIKLRLEEDEMHPDEFKLLTIIQDNGVGMSKAKKKTLFKMFQVIDQMKSP